MEHHHRIDHASIVRSNRLVIAGLAALLVAYLLAAALGWPQAGTARIVGDQQHAQPHHGGAEEDQQAAGVPPLAMVAPFALLLGAIAVFPLLPHTAHWWESNLNRLYVALILAGITLAYYLFLHDGIVDRHFLNHAEVATAEQGLSWHATGTVLANAILNEYVPFIVLLFSLFTISGGIRVDGDLAAHPLTNTAFLAIGGLMASIVGTTGAAMLLIRPLLDTNRERKHVAHTVVFFIFIVCNCGGCLTPLGDPPLFLGYLRGVDFLWTLRLWPQWLLVNSLLLAAYFVWDRLFAYPRETTTDIARDERLAGTLRISGLAVNGVLLVLLIALVALLDPSKPFPGTTWHPWLYLREAAQLGLVAASLAFGSVALRAANRFSYAPIIEVAALFLGIFVCMQPALQILDARGASLGIDTPTKFFWATGSLSSVLDNAPTYLVFFETARTLGGDAARMAGVQELHLAAISLGAVFMGAMTYIGNGPNFMVKAVAESADVRMPSFFGYLLYSFCILLPILVVTTLISF